MRWIFFAFVLLSRNALSQEKLVLAAEDSWPPYAKRDGTGISRDIITAALASTGTDVEFVIVPYARALKMAEDGKVDGAFNVTKQASTLERFAFGKEPLLMARASYFYPKDTTASYHSANEIPDGTSIALIIGYEYGNVYEANRARFKEVRVSSQKQIVRLVQTGKVDMAIMFDEVARYTLDSMNLNQNTLRKGHLNHVSEIYIAFSKQADNLAHKIALLDNGLAALAKDAERPLTGHMR